MKVNFLNQHQYHFINETLIYRTGNDPFTFPQDRPRCPSPCVWFSLWYHKALGPQHTLLSPSVPSEPPGPATIDHNPRVSPDTANMHCLTNITIQRVLILTTKKHLLQVEINHPHEIAVVINWQVQDTFSSEKLTDL